MWCFGPSPSYFPFPTVFVLRVVLLSPPLPLCRVSCVRPSVLKGGDVWKQWIGHFDLLKLQFWCTLPAILKEAVVLVKARGWGYCCTAECPTNLARGRSMLLYSSIIAGIVCRVALPTFRVHTRPYRLTLVRTRTTRSVMTAKCCSICIRRTGESIYSRSRNAKSASNCGVNGHAGG